MADTTITEAVQRLSEELGRGGYARSHAEFSADLEALLSSHAALVEAVRPFAEAVEHDIGETEADDDTFRNSTHNRAPKITVGHLRTARDAYLKAKGEDHA